MRLFSTEQVSKYHPDKVCDQISDAILTECLKQDKHSHVAVETMFKGTTIVLGGEVTTAAEIEYEAIAKRVAKKLGYKATKVINLLSAQSQEINNAVESDENLGAGDQGIMFGFATAETETYLPFGFDLANKIIQVIENDVETNKKTILKGDAKTQVTVDMDTNELHSVVISVCHKEGKTLEEVQEYVANLMKGYFELKNLTVNPSGTWTIGGPVADCGMTGRKIVCDQYGGYCAVGGGAFSGKDPTKVDRSASYMARAIAKNIVKTFKVDWATVQLGYVIGQAQPVSVIVDTPTGDYNEFVKETYDLTPKGIIETLNLLEVDYEKLAEGCHYR